MQTISIQTTRGNDMATVMTMDRMRVSVDAAWMAANAAALFYVQAADGVWVPTCDLSQYEQGLRPFRF